jgi:large subunit GTPase 1
LFSTDYAFARRIWADYFDSEGIHYAFYSAANATARQELLREARDRTTEANQEKEGEVDVEESVLDADTSSTAPSGSYDSDKDADLDSDEDTEDARAKVLSVLELEDLFISSAPDLSGELAH